MVKKTNLFGAMKTNDTTTENGMVTSSTTLNACVDMFFHIGAMRGQDKQKKINLFVKAYDEDPLMALKILFWVRDVRGGAGERQTFKDIISYLVNNKEESLRKNIKYMPEFGRWDDLFVLFNSPFEEIVLELISEALKNENGLAAKWLPRPNVKSKDKKIIVKKIMRYLGLTPKQYRQLLAKLSDTVEQKMCKDQWGDINYSHVPSKAMSDYMNAFNKHDSERFSGFLESLKNGDVKINTGAIYPYDVIKNLTHGQISGANEQWNKLPNFMEGNKERLLPVVDTSGSMSVNVGGNPKLTCRDVAISLGLYISERNGGIFKDGFITFSTCPELQYVKGTLSDRVFQMKNYDWGFNTDLEAVFNLILEKAKLNNISNEGMPTMLLILSDMQFDQAVNYNSNAYQMVKDKYEKTGYNLPKIIFWNLRSVNTDAPIQFDENGTALISGFSPSILANVLGGTSLTPYSIMMDKINSERYDIITV